MTCAPFILLSLLRLCAATPAPQFPSQPPSQPPSLWEMANQLYEQGNYAQAISLYQSLLKTEGEHPWLHYNLGNAQFKRGDLASAILHFHRAWSLRPRDLEARFNLEFALEQAGEPWIPPGIPRPAYLAFQLLSLKELGAVSLTLYMHPEPVALIRRRKRLYTHLFTHDTVTQHQQYKGTNHRASYS